LISLRRGGGVLLQSPWLRLLRLYQALSTSSNSRDAVLSDFLQQRLTVDLEDVCELLEL